MGPRDAIIAHVNGGGGAEGRAGGETGEEAGGDEENDAAGTSAVERVLVEDAIGPRSFTLWGPAPPAVRRWLSTELHPARTYVDVKECNRIETLVIGFYGVIRPFYARFA